MKVTKSLLLKYSRDECSDEEKLAVREWLNNGSWPILPNGEDIPERMKQKIWAKVSLQMPNLPFERKRKTNHWIWKIAAVFIVLIATAGLLYQNSSFSQQEITYVTKEGQHEKIILPDSSVVFLLSHSSLTVDEGFGKKNRKLTLKGAASFEVMQNADYPFTVISDEISTTALGTSFKVTSYSDENGINVALRYGKVVVEGNSTNVIGKKTFLNPGEEVIYNKESGYLQKSSASAKQFSYKNNILYFNDADLKEVIEKLERYYMVKVDTDHLGDVHWQVTGEFDYQPLEVVMKAIAYSCNVSYKIDHNNLIIKPK